MCSSSSIVVEQMEQQGCASVSRPFSLAIALCWLLYIGWIGLCGLHKSSECWQRRVSSKRVPGRPKGSRALPLKGQLGPDGAVDCRTGTRSGQESCETQMLERPTSGEQLGRCQ